MKNIKQRERPFSIFYLFCSRATEVGSHAHLPDLDIEVLLATYKRDLTPRPIAPKVIKILRAKGKRLFSVLEVSRVLEIENIT